MLLCVIVDYVALNQQGCSEQIALQGQDLLRMNLAHDELESVNVIDYHYN